MSDIDQKDIDGGIMRLIEMGLLDEYNDLRTKLYLLLDNAQAGFYEEGRVYIDSLKRVVCDLPALYRHEEDIELQNIALDALEEEQ
jgi:hypothetical protein